MSRPRGIALTILLAAASQAACVHTTKLSPGVMNMALVTGAVDGTHTCTPPSAPAPDPAGWWSSRPPSVRGLAVVGQDIWRNQTDSCEEHKEVAHRGLFQYDLSPVMGVKDLITKATLGFHSQVLPSGASSAPTAMCQTMTGGAGSLHHIWPTPTQFASNMVVLRGSILGSGLPATGGFPASRQLFGFPWSWQAGTIAPGVTTSPAGPDRAGFDVDVTTRVRAVLTGGATVVQFMLVGIDEAFPLQTPPADSLDCKTMFQIDDLVVEWVGS
jgi:hypothetical protein